MLTLKRSGFSLNDVSSRNTAREEKEHQRTGTNRDLSDALVEAAGGKVLDMASGEPLSYGKPRWENASFICSGRD